MDGTSLYRMGLWITDSFLYNFLLLSRIFKLVGIRILIQIYIMETKYFHLQNVFKDHSLN